MIHDGLNCIKAFVKKAIKVNQWIKECSKNMEEPWQTDEGVGHGTKLLKETIKIVTKRNINHMFKASPIYFINMCRCKMDATRFKIVVQYVAEIILMVQERLVSSNSYKDKGN